MAAKNPNRQNSLPLHKVLIIGSSGVRKHDLILHFMYGDSEADYELSDQDSYKQDSYVKKVVVDGEEVQIEIRDLSGMEDYQAVIDSYIQKAEGFLCAFSITEQKTFAATAWLRDQIMLVKECDNVPFLLVGIQSDAGDKREVSVDEATCKAAKWNVEYMEIPGAQTQAEVQKVFFNLLRQIKAYKMESKHDEDVKKKQKSLAKIIREKLFKKR
ncbi:ras-related Ral-A [Pelobates cultripes]|uniref:Ras-related Ral-A n=1 Tax=Pelobates cultripes TaxID=61616 RepID=A0AAD1W0R7_PELCU|nr:ras-related Ral-A [Pelobates cultripes]